MHCKDNRQERFLTKFGTPWRYSNKVRFEDLIPGWDQANFGRSEVKKRVAIDEYKLRMQEGSPAPAPILRKTDKGLEVLDGVQRLCATSEIGTSEFAAYIVDTDSPQLVKVIRIFANQLLQGHPESSEWTRQQAIQLLVIEGGMSTQEVARTGGWSLQAVEDDKIAMDWGFAIRCHGGPQKINKGILLGINRHAKMDDLKIAPEPVVEFIGDLKRGQFSNGDSQEHIEAFFDVNRKQHKGLHKQFVRHLERFHAIPDVITRLKGRQPTRLTPELKLQKAMKGVQTIAEKLNAAGHEIRYMEEFFQIWNRVDKHLKAIAKQSKGKAVKV